MEAGRTGLGAPVVEDAPARVDRRFLASATAPEAAGFVTVRVVLVELMLGSLVWPAGLVVAGLEDDVGEVTLDDAAGFLVVVVVEVAAGFGLVPGELAEVALDKVEVRRAAVPSVEVLRLFSSSDADG